MSGRDPRPDARDRGLPVGVRSRYVALRRYIAACGSTVVALSGGVDSATVLSFLPRGARAFTLGFDEWEYDERPLARLAASSQGAMHECVLAQPDARGALPRLTWHLDDPLADSSARATFLLAEFARERVKVVLNGDGGE